MDRQNADSAEKRDLVAIDSVQEQEQLRQIERQLAEQERLEKAKLAEARAQVQSDADRLSQGEALPKMSQAEGDRFKILIKGVASPHAKVSEASIRALNQRGDLRRLPLEHKSELARALASSPNLTSDTLQLMFSLTGAGSVPVRKAIVDRLVELEQLAESPAAELAAAYAKAPSDSRLELSIELGERLKNGQPFSEDLAKAVLQDPKYEVRAILASAFESDDALLRASPEIHERLVLHLEAGQTGKLKPAQDVLERDGGLASAQVESNPQKKPSGLLQKLRDWANQTGKAEKLLAELKQRDLPEKKRRWIVWRIANLKISKENDLAIVEALKQVHDPKQQSYLVDKLLYKREKFDPEVVKGIKNILNSEIRTISPDRLYRMLKISGLGSWSPTLVRNIVNSLSEFHSFYYLGSNNNLLARYTRELMCKDEGFKKAVFDAFSDSSIRSRIRLNGVTSLIFKRNSFYPLPNGQLDQSVDEQNMEYLISLAHSLGRSIDRDYVENLKDALIAMGWNKPVGAR